MVRLVCDPEGAVLVDRYLKAPGRGAHLCYDPGCVQAAVKRRAFGRAFRRSVKPVEADRLVAHITAAIEARIRDRLAIGRSAGWARSGTDVLARLKARLALIVLAEDTASGTAERIRRWGHPERCPVIVYGDRVLLGATQGQAERVAVGITDRDMARSLFIEFERRDRLGVAA